MEAVCAKLWAFWAIIDPHTMQPDLFSRHDERGHGAEVALLGVCICLGMFVHAALYLVVRSAARTWT